MHAEQAQIRNAHALRREDTGKKNAGLDSSQGMRLQRNMSTRGRGVTWHIAIMERDAGSGMRLEREDTSDVCIQWNIFFTLVYLW